MFHSLLKLLGKKIRFINVQYYANNGTGFNSWLDNAARNLFIYTFISSSVESVTCAFVIACSGDYKVILL